MNKQRLFFQTEYKMYHYGAENRSNKHEIDFD